MIKKKIVSQKGFRLDNRIINKIEELSNSTGRSQNELAEKAFQMLFLDNIVYFIENEVINKIYGSECAEIGFGGLYFIIEENILLIFSQNVDNQMKEIGIACLKCCIPCLELNNLKEYVLDKINKAKNYNSFLIDILVTDDDEEFQNQLHESILKIDLDFPEMQNWIKSEFDFT